MARHKNYEILNLIGYGLAKFDADFLSAFGCPTKTAFYQKMVEQKIAETIGTVKNRQDLFDHFFDNGRKGWWQKGNAYIHRKQLIDALYGTLDAKEFAQVVKAYLGITVDEIAVPISPLLKSKFRQLQETGREAELYFVENFQQIELFKNGSLEDARLFGDGYDFQVEVAGQFYLAEIKGLRASRGSVRLTQKEYLKAQELGHHYGLIVVSNLETRPKLSSIFNPLDLLSFRQQTVIHEQISYRTESIHW